MSFGTVLGAFAMSSAFRRWCDGMELEVERLLLKRGGPSFVARWIVFFKLGEMVLAIGDEGLLPVGEITMIEGKGVVRLCDTSSINAIDFEGHLIVDEFAGGNGAITESDACVSVTEDLGRLRGEFERSSDSQLKSACAFLFSLGFLERCGAKFSECGLIECDFLAVLGFEFGCGTFFDVREHIANGIVIANSVTSPNFT